ncbi:MAG: Ku protein, partial [Acidimicrobiia bacterium]|nr:Ku protein [Acidimicrobiia bacterium]
MARAIWSGSISFGLVNIPIRLYPAVSKKSVSFHQVDSKTGSRVKMQRVSAADGSEVPYEQIVKGYEMSPDHYVLIDPDELDALDPEATRTIDIEE